MKRFLTFSFFLFPFSFLLAATSEISVDLKLDQIDFLSGERIRGEVNIVNTSPNEVSIGYADSKDRFFIEVFRASDHSQLESISDRVFIAPVRLKPCEGMRLETFLSSHYGLRNPSHYLAKPILVHNGMRYEGQTRAFDVVPGMRIGGALQMFSNHPGFQREFDLVSWNRKQEPHLFLRATDSRAKNSTSPASGSGRTTSHQWRVVDLGMMMNITTPTISVLTNGVVVILHRVDPDNFIRSEFWSVPDDLIFNERELIQDPETAGTARVREMYKESGGIKPKENPWWKFW